MTTMSTSMLDPFSDNPIQDITDDYLLALSLQAIEDEFNSESPQNTHKSDPKSDVKTNLTNGLDEVMDPKGIVSPDLELSDPSPNIWELMRTFDRMFFGGVLANHCVELSWSSRMTSTAGLCGWSPTTNYCFIRLSLPLLQLRSRKDLVETLIHEMIHAILFVTRQDDNHESHGPKFHDHMYRINAQTGANITVYHTFHNEVQHYQRHEWRCDGRCRSRSPYFGYLRRAMNRPPGPSDYWFKYHEQSCGGKFVKTSEPSKTDKLLAMKSNDVIELTPEKLNNQDIRQFLTPNVWKTGGPVDTITNDFHKQLPTNRPITSFGHKSVKKTETISKPPMTVPKCDNYNSNQTMKLVSSNGQPVVPFTGKGYVLGNKPTTSKLVTNTKAKSVSDNQKPNTKRLPTKKSTTKPDIEVIQID